MLCKCGGAEEGDCPNFGCRADILQKWDEFRFPDKYRIAALEQKVFELETKLETTVRRVDCVVDWDGEV